MPLIAFVIVLRAIFPLRPGFNHFELGVTSQGAEPVWINPPAIDRIAMFIARGRRDYAKQTPDFQGSRHLSHR